MVEYDRARAKKKNIYINTNENSKSDFEQSYYERKMFDNLRITRRRIEKVGV